MKPPSITSIDNNDLGILQEHIVIMGTIITVVAIIGNIFCMPIHDWYDICRQ